ncbi:Zinc dependent phospholipase C [Anatilimnocola aggregata]|uniref:Zinc dependent phospholipase C n=1 Tax=Anatilimnocola aggregata TaxID=2528021 RepID=A0A517YIX7_9BACT|nr:DUF4332 domain-containing protein [Anatilimnocola aggregata]QDU30183.1 Zinc dependent phospholipase C [Anatilimnocola aggregata]
MSLLFKVVFASAARSTHHKLALDALRQLRGHDAQAWMDVFLRYNRSYLEGAKAPDTQFKDFKNHVLHVQDNYWGGAVAATQKWYAAAHTSFQNQDWEEAAYSVGVLSHYFSDALMPLHTGQSEDEGPIHRAVEWSVCKSYGELRYILETNRDGYPRWECPTGDDWLAQMVRRAAEISNPHYDTVIDHYNLALGTRDPLQGLDQTLKDCLAKCLGFATVGLARIIEKLIDETKSVPPFVDVTLQGIVAAAKMPFRMLAKHIEDVRERETLRLIYDEFERTGKVVDNLSADDAEVRKLHAEEVLHTSLTKLNAQPIRKPGERHGQSATQRDRSVKSVSTAPISDNREQSARVAPEPTKISSAVERLLKEAETKPTPVPRDMLKPKEEVLSPWKAPTQIADEVKPVAPAVPAKAKPESPAVLKMEPIKVESPKTEPKKAEPKPAVAEPAKKAEAAKPKEKEKEKPAAESKLKFYLDRSKQIQDAPSIGNKTAERMRGAGVSTVGELLASHPEKLAAKLNVAHIIPDVIRQWQAEATLCCRVPGLRGHDAQILVACGIDQPAELAECEVDDLLDLIQPFVESPDGQRVLRGSSPPDEEEVTEWIAAAKQARSLKAA